MLVLFGSVLTLRPGVRFSWFLGWWWSASNRRSRAQRWPDLVEAGERGGELGCPGPADVDLDPGLALAADDPGGGVQQPVTQQLGFQQGEGSLEQDGLG